MRHAHVRQVLASASLIALAIVPASAIGASPAPPSQAPFDLAHARASCTSAGGTVQERRPVFGTNSDQAAWTWLPGSVELCRFQTLASDDSVIYIDLASLVATEPLLATVAYLSRVPLDGPNDGSNPATRHCADLGGSASFGGGASGGGWVALDEPVLVVVGMCAFPDLSMIDEWGIAYYTDGTVRGIDLAPVIGYQPTGGLPPFLPS